MSDPTNAPPEPADDRPNVYQVVAAIKRGMPSIGKTRKMEGNDGSGNYRYRGIDDIVDPARELEGQHGLVIVPYVDVTEVVPSPGMKPGWRDTTVDVTWGVYGPRGDMLLVPQIGPDGALRQVPPTTRGVGRDKSDKGVNKGLTMAWKQLLVILYSVGGSGDDPDDARPAPASEYVEHAPAGRASGAGQAPAVPAIPPDELERRVRVIMDRAKTFPEPVREALSREWVATGPDGQPWLPVTDAGRPSFTRLRPSDIESAEGLVAKYAAEAERYDAADPTASEPVAEPEAAQATEVADRSGSTGDGPDYFGQAWEAENAAAQAAGETVDDAELIERAARVLNGTELLAELDHRRVDYDRSADPPALAALLAATVIGEVDAPTPTG